MTMERTATTGIVTGWIGTLGTLMTDAEAWIKVLVVLVALVASAFGAVAAYYTSQAKRADQRRSEYAAALELARLCEQCRDGHPPPLCPFPQIDRPKDCPHPEI